MSLDAHAPGTSPLPLNEDPPDAGLTAGEVAQRKARGLANVDASRHVSDWDVIRRNVLTLFNVTLASLIIALLMVGEIRDGIFVGGVVLANVLIATGQELVAMRRLQALQTITSPRAMVIRDGVEHEVQATEVVRGDLLVLAPGGQVVADGTIEAGVVELDESMLTGESASVRREAGDQIRSGVYCIGGNGRFRAERVGADAYAFRLAADVRDVVVRQTPLMLQFNRLLRVLLTATAVLAAALFIQFNVQERGLPESLKATTATVTTVVPVGMLLGITVVVAVGALRVSRAGAIVQDMYAVEALNYIDVVAFDKTGTITSNKLELTDVLWVGPEADRPWLATFAADAAGESRTIDAIGDHFQTEGLPARHIVNRVPFSSGRRWSGVEWDAAGERRAYVLGAPETILGIADDGLLGQRYAEAAGRGLRGVVFARVDELSDEVQSLTGVTPLALVVLADELRDDIREAFGLMDALAIEPKIISGDHPDTVAALLAQLGITPSGATASGDALQDLSDDELAEAVEHTSIFGRIDPQLKARIVTALKSRDRFVAMVGDGANDVHALRAADVGVAMASGTQMATGVAGIILLNDSFTAFIRGIREATFVLGNCRRLTKLFLAKSIYAFLLILATNMLGLDFPFLPRQAGITTALSLGIPAFFIAIGVPSNTSPRDISADVVRFALPAGLALAAAAIAMQFIVEGLLGRSIEEARTLVNVTIAVVGVLYAVEVLGLEDVNPRRPTRLLLTLVLAAALLATLVAVMSESRLRGFFAFEPMSGIGWASVVVAASAALSAQYMLARHWHQALDFLTARPDIQRRPRGKAK